MTLHWWMHWFWVTAQIVVTLTIPTTTIITDQQQPDLESTTTAYPITTTTTTTAETLARLQQNYRIAKAIGLQQQPMDMRSDSLRLLVTTDSPRGPRIVTSPAPSFDGIGLTSNSTINNTNNSNITINNQTSAENTTETRTTQPGRIPGKKEAKITWVHAFSKAPRPKNKTTLSPITTTTTSPSPTPSNETLVPEESLTVMPLKEDLDRVKSLDPNAIRREPPPPAPLPIVNRSLVASISREEIIEPHIVATAASILDAGIGDSTRLGRARGTFTSKFQHEQQQQLGNGDDNGLGELELETSRKESSDTGANVTEIATITGSCLAVVALLSTVGSVGFIMYRRRYLNPPQTLNSDKCSNPDSSGYIDDSTIRDNSEEMYSLDNDSFLNSLEAMTIQNYWTDVKHTKL